LPEKSFHAPKRFPCISERPFLSLKNPMATLSVKWPSHLKETKKLKELQTLLSKKVKILPLKSQPSFIAGVDCAFLKDSIVSAASLFTFPDIKPVEDVWSIRKNRFPCIPIIKRRDCGEHSVQ